MSPEVLELHEGLAHPLRLGLGKEEYLPLLQPLAEDPNPEVVKAAREAIEGLKSRP